MKRRRSSSGFVFIFSLILAFCAGVILAGTIGYVSFAARQSSVSAARSSCRLAAMSAIEKVKNDVYLAFKKRMGNKSVLGMHVYDWFTVGWSPTGLGSDNFHVNFDTSLNPLRDRLGGFTDLRVRLRSAPVNAGNRAEVTFFATASRMTGSGTPVSVTIAERVSFGVDRSKVFDYAYFVNNYGWFEGSTITANGGVRANGDMSLSQSPKVNGDVYAAVNEELGVPGNITNGQGTMDNKSTYRSSQYGTSNRARPLQREADDGGYNAPDKVTAADLTARLHGNLPEGVDMPWISGLNDYINYGQEDEMQSTLSQGGVYYVDNRVSNKNGVNYGYYQGTGPSGDASLPDNHALVLEGTQANPIRINGPVVVSNDVVIKGYVTGQGTIYSSRNIHIVGNIQYVNPPSWVNKEAASGNGNSAKDLLCLAAKGNIVMGDCTSSGWLDNTLKKVLTQKPYVQPYACAQADDGTWIDGDIGYPRPGKNVFEGNYTAADGGSRIIEKTPVYKTDRWGRSTGVIDHYVYRTSARRYCDSVVAPEEIHNRATTITQIDAVLYNNHGIFGKLGQCTINGSLVCRNEGMIFSGKLYLNWDYRLYSGSPENVMNKLVGMPLGTGKPIVQFWQEVPNEWNAD